MKHLLLILFCMIQMFAAEAQYKRPIQWKFSMEEDTIPNQYIITAKATLDSGWHIFTNEPGGDGLLLATDFAINADSAITNISPIQLIGNVIQKEIEFMGTVNYFEQIAVFQRTLTLNEKIPISGSIRYQICTHEMCLPPDEELFLIKP